MMEEVTEHSDLGCIVKCEVLSDNEEGEEGMENKANSGYNAGVSVKSELELDNCNLIDVDCKIEDFDYGINREGEVENGEPTQSNDVIDIDFPVKSEIESDAENPGKEDRHTSRLRVRSSALKRETAVECIDTKFSRVDKEGKKLRKEKYFFQCKMCPKILKCKSHFNQHTRSHLGIKPFWCKLCDKSFTTQQNLTIHSQLHTDEKPYTCEICSQCFRTKSILMEHIKGHLGIKPFKCATCCKSFRRKVHLTDHIYNLHSGLVAYSCALCNTDFASYTQLKRHSRLHSGETFPCTDCAKSFKSTMSLKQHILSHAAAVYSCQTCKTKHSTEYSLKLHNRSFHSGQKIIFHCTSCPDQSFMTKAELELHYLGTHSEPDSSGPNDAKNIKSVLEKAMKIERKTWYYCEQCGKRLNSRLELSLHSQEHVKNPAHYCQFCGVSFSETEPWKIHMLFHQGENSSGKEPVKVAKKTKTYEKFSCRVCGETFKMRGSLISHEICVHSL